VTAPDIFAIFFDGSNMLLSAGETIVCQHNTKLALCADIGL
jgi:hypothetical protein